MNSFKVGVILESHFSEMYFQVAAASMARCYSTSRERATEAEPACVREPESDSERENERGPSALFAAAVAPQISSWHLSNGRKTKVCRFVHMKCWLHL